MLVLNGSPNQNSLSMAFAEQHFKLADAEIYDAYTMDAAACDDCKRCETYPTCRFIDDTTRFLERLYHHDTLLIVSPIHFGTLSAKTLTVISRFQELFNRKHSLKMATPHLKAVHIVATAGADNPAMFEGLSPTHAILKTLFKSDVGTLYTKANTDTDQHLKKR